MNPELLPELPLDSADLTALEERSHGPEFQDNHRVSLDFSGLDDLLPETVTSRISLCGLIDDRETLAARRADP